MMRVWVLLLLVALGLAAACKREPAEAEKPAAVAKPPEHESSVARGTNGAVVVRLEPAAQKLAGLQTSSLRPASLNPELKAYGTVLDTSPLISLVAELTAAHANSQASEAELKRLKTLLAQNNTSERALQTAEATAARDQSLVQAARLRLLAAWGRGLAERKDLTELIQSLSSLESCLVELHLPAGTPLSATPSSARVRALDDQSPVLETELLGPASIVDPMAQGHAFLLLVAHNSGRLAPGAAVTGFLVVPGQPRQGVLVPRNAIVRFNGAGWVYLQSAEDAFQRVEVPLDSPLENGWFVSQDLKPGDNVVTVGAQQLLSEELKGTGGED